MLLHNMLVQLPAFTEPWPAIRSSATAKEGAVVPREPHPRVDIGELALRIQRDGRVVADVRRDASAALVFEERLRRAGEVGRHRHAWLV
eukprot:gene11655-biopygen3840